jgi:hypothetical protein
MEPKQHPSDIKQSFTYSLMLWLGCGLFPTSLYARTPVWWCLCGRNFRREGLMHGNCVMGALPLEEINTGLKK